MPGPIVNLLPSSQLHQVLSSQSARPPISHEEVTPTEHFAIPTMPNYKGNPRKAAFHLRETLFPSGPTKNSCKMMVYIFTMPDNFLILMSPGFLPFTPFTHSADGLSGVNPLYCHPVFSYNIPPSFYYSLQKQHAGVEGVPPLLALKGSWHTRPYPEKYCYKNMHDLFSGAQLCFRNFTLRALPNVWQASEAKQGLAFRLDGRAFRVWFHEKNPKALTNALCEKRDNLKKLENLQKFLLGIREYSANWHVGLFSDQTEIKNLGKWAQVTRILPPGHPDKTRNESERHSSKIQALIKQLKAKFQEVKKCKKKPTEKAQKLREQETIRLKLTQAFKAFFDETNHWINASNLSIQDSFLSGLAGEINGVKRELSNLKKSKDALSEKELEALGCPRSAYASTMQIESHMTPSAFERGIMFKKVRFRQINWLLGQLGNTPHQKAPSFSKPFFEDVVNFLQYKYAWTNQFGIKTHFDPRKFLNTTRYHIDTLNHLEQAFNDLYGFFAGSDNCIPQANANNYPYLVQELGLLNDFYRELKMVVQKANPRANYQFYNEMLLLSDQLDAIRAGGSLYKRLGSGGNVEWELISQGSSSKLNALDHMHTPIYV